MEEFFHHKEHKEHEDTKTKHMVLILGLRKHQHQEIRGHIENQEWEMSHAEPRRD